MRYLPRRFTVLLAAALSVGAAGAVAQTKTGKFFKVTCEGGDEHTAKLALNVVEPIWNRVCAVFGVPGLKPKKPLSVVLYRDVAGYQKADRRLTGGKFQPNQAMSHWDSLSAHVAMQPPVDDAYLRRFGLPMQTKAMLLWEACHVARFELCRNFRVHPGWFIDGLAASVAGDVLQELHPLAGEQPFFTQRWWRVRKLAETNKLPSVADLLRDRTQSLDMRNRYAVRLALFEFVRKHHNDKLRPLAAKIRRTGAGTSYARKVQKAAVDALGDLDGEFRKWAAAKSPVWDERARSLWCDGIAWYQTAFARTTALAFHSEPVAGDTFEARGTVWIHDGKAQQMNFLFGRTEQGYYSLAIVAGTGFKVFEYRVAGNQWRVLGSGNEPGCRAGVDVPFAVKAVGTDLEVQLGTGTWQVKLPKALTKEVIWGVGAQAGRKGAVRGSAGVWRGVVVSGS